MEKEFEVIKIVG